MMFMAITLFASTVSRSQFAAAGISINLLIFLSLLGTIPSLSPHLPASLIDWGYALALRLDAEPAWMALAVTVAVTALAWFAAWLILQRQ